MYWKLRIPLMLAVFGVTAGLFDGIFGELLEDTSYFTKSASYLIIVGVIIFVLEKTGINDKRVHALIGIAIIVFTVIFEEFMLGFA